MLFPRRMTIRIQPYHHVEAHQTGVTPVEVAVRERLARQGEVSDWQMCVCDTTLEIWSDHLHWECEPETPRQFYRLPLKLAAALRRYLRAVDSTHIPYRRYVLQRHDRASQMMTKWQAYVERQGVRSKSRKRHVARKQVV